MEELKFLLEIVKDLPSAAIWVIALLYAYKVIVLGSIYGVLRLAIIKAHDWLANRSENVTYKVEGRMIGAGGMVVLERLLRDVRVKENKFSSYIRKEDLLALEQVWNNREGE